MSPTTSAATLKAAADLSAASVDDILARDDEEALRIQLAAAYRMVHHYGWDRLTVIYGHLTARVPGPEKHFLINPYGLRYEEVRASNLVKIDLDGEPVEPTDYGVNPAGFAIHGAIHDGVAGAHSVMHTHTRAGMAVAALECGLLPISMAATSFAGGIGYHDYGGSVVDDEEKPRLIADLGNQKALILRNHGLLTVGRTVWEAFIHLFRLESASEVQVTAQAANTGLVMVPPEICEKSATQMDMLDGDEWSREIGLLPFAATMRLMDEIDPSYRH